jgi:hypothetical protein
MTIPLLLCADEILALPPDLKHVCFRHSVKFVKPSQNTGYFVEGAASSTSHLMANQLINELSGTDRAMMVGHCRKVYGALP